MEDETKVQVFGTNFCLDAGSGEWRPRHYRRLPDEDVFTIPLRSPSERCWDEDLDML